MGQEIAATFPRVALAFRGYDVANLGKTAQLLQIPAYASIVSDELDKYSCVCSEVIQREVDLKREVLENREPDLSRYAEAVALIVAVEIAQLRLLREVHSIDYLRSQFAFGYSLGEMSALCATSDFQPEQLIRIPLAMAADCVELAHDVTMAILFSRGDAIIEEEVWTLCHRINIEGKGVIGISSVLSPNTMLLLGQGDTIDRFQSARQATPLRAAHLRTNPHRWPPLHTHIVRQRHVPDRSAVMLDRLSGGERAPRPRVFSLVTGTFAYADCHAREVLRRWIDHPQRLWDAVEATLAEDIEAVWHVGPAPNLIPATFHRVAENVAQQTSRRSLESFGLRAVRELVRRPWLAAMLPSRAALLKAPTLQHIILEDWLIDHAPA